MSLHILAWNDEADLAFNLKNLKDFIDEAQKSKLVSNETAANQTLSMRFIKKLSDLQQECDKTREEVEQNAKARPQQLTKEAFIGMFFQCLKATRLAYYEEVKQAVLQDMDMDEKQLGKEAGLLVSLHRFKDLITKDKQNGVDVDFENFEPEGLFETEVGTFLLCSAHGDWQEPVYFFLYLVKDSNKLHWYVPVDGNFWDVENRCAHDDPPDLKLYEMFDASFLYSNDKMLAEVIKHFKEKFYV